MGVMRAMIKRWIALIIGCLLFSACGKSSNEPAHLQFLSMISSAKDVTIQITPANASSAGKKISLNYAEPSGYQPFKPGTYDITYAVSGDPILKRTFVLGKKSYQTLLAAGMLTDSLRTNPHTRMSKIMRIVAGSESSDVNGYMPQFVMLRDLYRGKKSSGMIRFVNASPLTNTLKMKKGPKKLKTLSYPKYGEPMPITSGSGSYQFYFGRIPLANQTFRTEKGHIRTIITGNTTAKDSVLTLATYQIQSESIRD